MFSRIEFSIYTESEDIWGLASILVREMNMINRSQIRLFFERAIYALIFVNIFAIVAHSHEPIKTKYDDLFIQFEVFTYLVFSVEYVIRLIAAARSKKGLWNYVFSFFGLVDLMAVMPFYLPLILPVDSLALRTLRLMRLVNIFKIGRHSKAIMTLMRVLNLVRMEVTLMLFTSIIVVVFAGIVMFYLENEAQPELFSNMSQSIWWAVATLTTIGYGDIYPVTAMGKFIASVLAFVGIGLVAIPAGLISAAYVEEIKSQGGVQEYARKRDEEHKANKEE